MFSVIFGLAGLLMLVGCPILLVWGFWRVVIFQGAEYAAMTAEKTQGAAFANKQKRQGYWLLLASPISGLIGFWFFFYLANYFS